MVKRLNEVAIGVDTSDQILILLFHNQLDYGVDPKIYRECYVWKTYKVATWPPDKQYCMFKSHIVKNDKLQNDHNRMKKIRK